MTTYASYDAAAKRVTTLTQQGIWPGIVAAPGGWALTFDPDDPKGSDDA